MVSELVIGTSRPSSLILLRLTKDEEYERHSYLSTNEMIQVVRGVNAWQGLDLYHLFSISIIESHVFITTFVLIRSVTT